MTNLPINLASAPNPKTNLPINLALAPMLKTNLPINLDLAPSPKTNLPINLDLAPIHKTNLPINLVSILEFKTKHLLLLLKMTFPDLDQSSVFQLLLHRLLANPSPEITFNK